MSNTNPPVVKPISANKSDCQTTQKSITLRITHNSTGKAADLRHALGNYWSAPAFAYLGHGLTPIIVKLITALLPGEATHGSSTVSYGCINREDSVLNRPTVSRDQATQDRKDFQGFPEKVKRLRVIVIDEDTGKELMNEKVSN